MQRQINQERISPSPLWGFDAQAVVKALLLCGVLSFVLYVAMDAIVALRYEGYSYRSQTISELSAVGAPTRGLWVVFGFAYAVLALAFGFGVWASAARNRALRVTGGLLIAGGLVSLLAWPFAPMHQREVLAAGGGTWSDTMHLVLAGVNSTIFLLMIGFGAAALGWRFRIYSIATILVLLVFGTLTGLDAPAISDNESTPWVGITERINVFGAMLWMAVLGLVLLGRRSGEAPAAWGPPG